MVTKSLLSLAALAAAASTVSAHSIVTSVWVNGEDTLDASVGTASSYMRAPSSNSPQKSLSASSLACNDRGTTAVSGYLTVAPGDTIEPEWWHSGARGADAIDTSHKGPLTTWISPLSANTEGAVWVQIASEAYYSSSSQWAVEKMAANAGRNTVKIPDNLAPGDYLIRFDLLGLHEAQSAGGAQFYPNCAQVTVTGSGTQELPAGVEIPGFFTEDTPGIVWNIYYSSDYDVTGDYVAPGTGIWDGSATYSTDTCHETVDGLAPAGYCQGGSNSTSPASSTSASKAASSTVAASSSAAATTSRPAASSSAAAGTTAVASTTSKAAFESSSAAATTSRAASSSAAASQGSTSTSSRASGTTSAADSTYTDYNSCMRAYNKCLDEHQPKNGGAADFSSCYSSFNCSSLQRLARQRRAPQPKLHGKDRVVRRAH